jgi:hypothetical protein
MKDNSNRQDAESAKKKIILIGGNFFSAPLRLCARPCFRSGQQLKREKEAHAEAQRRREDFILGLLRLRGEI